jgi:hypothetical protein
MKKILITEAQLRILKTRNQKETYFDSFSSAVQHARTDIENRGYEIVEDDWWNEVNMGPGRPKEGQTVRISLGLIKNEKPQRKKLHIIIYNRGIEIKNNYELTYYIS